MAEIRANNVPDKLVQQFDIERAKRGRMSIRDAVIEAIQLWMSRSASGEKAAQPLPPSPDLTPEEREWVEAFIRYLRSDEPFKEHILEIMRTAFNMPSTASQPRKRAVR